MLNVRSPVAIFPMASRRATSSIVSQLRQVQSRRGFNISPRAYISQPSSSEPSRKGTHPDDLDKLLSRPIWSVESLLPPKTRAPDAPKISSQQLHHLLRLSALPAPDTPEQEQIMLDTLAAQLHFVGEIQQVDTTGVKPLRVIRDETRAAEQEQTIGLDSLRSALEKETTIGKHFKRIQRDATPVDAKDVENWNVLGSAERKAGKYFVVESERPLE